MSVDRTWYELRALRATPPALAATDDERRAVFTAALRQSEELFEAARLASLASKPLPLFYALSQAGRAIAAAHLTSDTWQIIGHGLSIADADRDIASMGITARPRQTDAFGVVTRAIGSDGIEGTVSLAQVWASIPELEVLTGLRRGAPAVLGILPQDEMAPASLRLVRRSLVHGAQGLVLVPDVATEADVYRRLKSYARTEGSLVTIPPAIHDGIATVSLQWPDEAAEDVPRGVRRIRGLHEVAIECDGRWYLQPLIGESGTAPAPLMLWWMLLLALSSSARYHPAAWAAAIDLDKSQDAVELEEGLAIADRVLPRLLLRYLRRGDAPVVPLRALLRAYQEQ